MPKSKFEILDWRSANEAIDFNHDLVAAKLSRHGTLSSQIGEQGDFFELDNIWIMRNEPTGFHECVLYCVMNAVWSRHSNLYWSKLYKK